MAELSELDFYTLQYTGQQVDAALGQILNGEVQQAVEDAQQAAQEAQDAKQAVEDLSVSAQTLASSALARVTKTVGPDGAVTLTFGIPQGQPGQQGPAGPQGNPGAAVASEGFWAVHIDSEGHLILDYDGDTPPDLEINEDGHLVYTVNGQSVDLGQVVGEGGSGGVTSFKGRTGAVDPQNGDYTADMVGALPISGGTLTGNLNIKKGARLRFEDSSGEGGALIYDESPSETTPQLGFYGNFGDELVLLNNVATPVLDYQAANKAYVDAHAGGGGEASIPYGTCSTAGATAAKVVSLPGFTLETGALVIVEFTYTNTSTTATLNVNATGAKQIYVGNSSIKTNQIQAGVQHLFRYDGTYWQLLNPCALPLTGGTMLGQLIAQTNTAYTTYQVRNAALVTSAPSSISNGRLAFVYE